MPTEIGVRDLKNHASRVLRAVRDDQSEYVVTLRGEPVAVLRPLDDAERRRLRQSEIEDALAEMRSLAADVAEAWTSESTAVELVSEQRR
jgi:prevent-host-death family protein